jgi:hypothetical protein
MSESGPWSALESIDNPNCLRSVLIAEASDSGKRLG